LFALLAEIFTLDDSQMHTCTFRWMIEHKLNDQILTVCGCVAGVMTACCNVQSDSPYLQAFLVEQCEQNASSEWLNQCQQLLMRHYERNKMHDLAYALCARIAESPG
jgi:hypothetical protein